MVSKAYLKSKERHNNGHPAQCHCYVCPSLFRNHIHGTQEQDRPHNVIENHQAQKGHENPQGDTHDLREGEKKIFIACAQHLKGGIAKPLLDLCGKITHARMRTATPHCRGAVKDSVEPATLSGTCSVLGHSWAGGARQLPFLRYDLTQPASGSALWKGQPATPGILAPPAPDIPDIPSPRAASPSNWRHFG